MSPGLSGSSRSSRAESSTFHHTGEDVQKVDVLSTLTENAIFRLRISDISNSLTSLSCTDIPKLKLFGDVVQLRKIVQ